MPLVDEPTVTIALVCALSRSTRTPLWASRPGSPVNLLGSMMKPVAMATPFGTCPARLSTLLSLKLASGLPLLLYDVQLWFWLERAGLGWP